MHPQPEPRTPSPRWLGPTLAVVLAWAWLAPSIGTLRERFLGVEYVDHYGTQWFYWYAGQVLRGLQSAASTDLFFHPWGKDVYGHTGSNILDAWLAQPFLAVFGQVAGYNVFVVAMVAVNVALAARLAGRWTTDPLARMLVGLLFGFQPYLLNELTEGRPTQVLVAFLLLFVDRFLRALDEPRWQNAAWAGFWLALAGYTYWFYAIFAGMGAVAATLVTVATRRADARAVLTRAAIAAGVAVALVLPVAMPMLGAAASGDVPGMLDVGAWDNVLAPITREGQLVALYTWQPLADGHGFWIMNLTGDEHYIPRLSPLPLALLLPLAALVLRPGRVPRGPLLAMAAVGTVLALGPLFIVGTVGIDNPLYTLLAEAVPPLRRLWWPGRAFVLVGLVASLGAIPLVEAARSVAARAGVAVALVGALGYSLFTTGLLPAAAWDASVPAGYRCLASGPPGAILELPYAFTQGHLYYQSAHGRPIFGGMLEDNPVFAPDEIVDLRATNTFVRAIVDAPPAADIDSAGIVEADRAKVRELGYAYVVLQLDAFRARIALTGMADVMMNVRLRAIRRSFNKVLGAPVYEDARVVIWSPWGLPAPCDLATFDRDEESPGRTDVVSTTRDSGAGTVISHLGRPEDLPARMARLVLERGGPDSDAAKRMLEALEGSTPAGEAKAAPAEAGAPPAPPAPPTPEAPAPEARAPEGAAP